MRADDTKGEERPYSPFRMGLQSYSLRRYTKDGRPDVKQALEATRQRLAP
jgi:inosose dehydratase